MRGNKLFELGIQVLPSGMHFLRINLRLVAFWGQSTSQGGHHCRVTIGKSQKSHNSARFRSKRSFFLGFDSAAISCTRAFFLAEILAFNFSR